MKLKKTALMVLCVVMCLSAVGCGTGKTEDNQNKATQQTEQKNDNGKSENADADKDKNGDNKESGADNGGESADAEQAPVIESGEELKSMVDEFNNTDDPEKKEELRKKLEAFLNQAEQQSSEATTENK